METAREIYLQACARLADSFEPDGFRWRSSLSELVKVDGDLRFSFRLQTSARNRLLASSQAPSRWSRLWTNFQGGKRSEGLFPSLIRQLREINSFGSVAIIPHVQIENPKFKAWKRDRLQQKDPNGTIAVTNLGYLMPKHQWLSVNLAKKESRARRTDEIAEQLRTLGIPFQLRFKNPAESAVWMATEESIPFRSFAILEYGYFCGGEALAKEVLGLLLSRFKRLDRIGSYNRSLEEFRSSGIPEVTWANEWEMLAKSALLLGLA